jgi:hypothetical protein
MPHDIVNGHIGHNHHHHDGDHLHSHLPSGDDGDDLRALCTQFIDGFGQAADKAAYLRLAGVPYERTGRSGPTPVKLVDVELRTEWQVGTASPSFGTRELSYLPYPGGMVTERTNMSFIYVSLDEKVVVDLREFLRDRIGEGVGA